jgi:hypothetical protein
MSEQAKGKRGRRKERNPVVTALIIVRQKRIHTGMTMLIFIQSHSLASNVIIASMHNIIYMAAAAEAFHDEFVQPYWYIS